MALIALRQTVILAMLMAVGALARKTGILNDERDKGLSAILLNIVTPCVVIANLGKSGLEEYRTGLLLSFLLASIIYLIYLAIVPLLFPKRIEYDYPIARFASTYPNAGYMGIPLVMALLGEVGVIYVTALIVIFNLFTFTHGAASLDREKNAFDPKVFLKPAVISIAIGMIFFFTPLTVPEIVREPMSMIADMNSPLAMLAVGSSLSKIDLRDLKNSEVLIKVLVFRLLLLPLIAIAVCALIPGDQVARMTSVIIYSCPSANLVLLFGIRYDRDTSLASQLVAVTTVFSIVTLPIMVGIGQFLVH